MPRFRVVFRNSASNMLGLAVTMAAGLFYVPYLAESLGVASYGMVPLITSLFVWVSWIGLAVSWSVGRYVTVSHEASDVKGQSTYLSSALFPAIGLAVSVGVAGLLLSPYVNRIVRAPDEIASSVQFLWACSAIVAALGIIGAAADVGTFCRNRFDLRAAMQVARTFTMVVTVLVLFHSRGPRLEWVGIGTIAGTLMYLVLVILSLRCLLPDVAIRPRFFDRQRFMEMLATNAWILVDQLGTILLLNVDLFLVNRLFGPQLTGEYGLALQWISVLKSMMTAMTVFTPSYVVFVARQDFTGLAHYALKASRFVGFAMAIPIGVVLGLADPLARTWLGREPGLVSTLILVLALPLTINASVNPLFGVWQALNKVRTPSYATLASGVSGVLLAGLLVTTSSLGVFAIVIAVSVAYSARNFGFALWYVARLLPVNKGQLLRASLQACLTSAAVGFAGHLLASFLLPKGWISLAFVASAATGVGIAFAWFVCLKPYERLQIALLTIGRFRSRYVSTHANG